MVLRIFLERNSNFNEINLGTTSRGIIGVRDETAVELENIFDEVGYSDIMTLFFLQDNKVEQV